MAIPSTLVRSRRSDGASTRSARRQSIKECDDSKVAVARRVIESALGEYALNDSISTLRPWSSLSTDEQTALRIAFGHYLDGLPPTCSLETKQRFCSWLEEQGVDYLGIIQGAMPAAAKSCARVQSADPVVPRGG